jgi:hypothetical protein
VKRARTKGFGKKRGSNSALRRRGLGVMNQDPFRLPPLILHPFSSPEDTSVLMQSSHASLVLHKYLPSDLGPDHELQQQLLRGRFAEFRMLFYVGKDLARWMEQCVEVTKMDPGLRSMALCACSFACYLVEDAPATVKQKLGTWGVLDYRALFRRSIGLHSVFSDVPPVSCLSADFLRRYRLHADRWYLTWAQGQALPVVDWSNFNFELYASGEYAMMLERSWAERSEKAP